MTPQGAIVRFTKIILPPKVGRNPRKLLKLPRWRVEQSQRLPTQRRRVLQEAVQRDNPRLFRNRAYNKINVARPRQSNQRFESEI